MEKSIIQIVDSLCKTYSFLEVSYIDKNQCILIDKETSASYVIAYNFVNIQVSTNTRLLDVKQKTFTSVEDLLVWLSILHETQLGIMNNDAIKVFVDKRLKKITKGTGYNLSLENVANAICSLYRNATLQIQETKHAVIELDTGAYIILYYNPKRNKYVEEFIYSSNSMSIDYFDDIDSLLRKYQRTINPKYMTMQDMGIDICRVINFATIIEQPTRRHIIIALHNLITLDIYKIFKMWFCVITDTKHMSIIKYKDTHDLVVKLTKKGFL